MTNRKRVLILATDCDSTNMVFNALDRDFEICAVVIEDAVSKKDLVRRRVKKLGPRTVAGQLAFKALVVPALAARGKRRIAAIIQQYGLDTSPIVSARRIRVPSVNSDECRNLLASQRPDLVVVNGTRIISKATLGATSARFINIHTGTTPLYRGVHGGYWALAQQDPQGFGVTVHFVDTGIDTGTILKQGQVEPTADDNFTTYPYLQYAVGLPLLKQATADVLSGEWLTQLPPDGPSRLWSHPTIGQYLINRLFRNVR